jgi:hypothetical protein
VTCREGPCPEGLACVDTVCVVPVDAAPDGMDGMDTPPPPALNCADPGILALNATESDDTTTRMDFIEASCGGFVNAGPDAVYKLDVTIGTQITVDITQGARKAYVIGQCTKFPGNCVGGARAVLGTPITITTATKPVFVIVDDEMSGVGSAYTLEVR